MALPIAAAPIAKMFLDAVGLSIVGLAAKDMVDVANKYIEANPDESMKILSTLVPNIGIGQIFMSKEDKISLEDLDEMTDEEAQDLSKEDKAELMKQAGKSGGSNKRQTMIDISEKLGLSGSGKEKQDIEYEIDERYDEGGVEEVSKPKFDYTKFFRKRRADGGAIGIEVLFREKNKNGGRIGFQGGGMDASQSDYKSPGSGSYSRSYNPGAGGVVQHNVGGGGGGPKGPDGPPSVINLPPTKDKSTELFTFDKYTGKPMTYEDIATANKFLNFVKIKGGYTMGEDTEADALYDAYKTATGRDTFMQDATVNSVTNMRTTDIDGNTKSFMDRTSTITDNPTGKMMKSLVVETPTNFTQRFITPSGIMENDVPQKFGDPQSLLVDPPKNIIGSELKDGGRVGFNLGGLLTGQAKSIYDNMTAAGYFTEDEIKNAIITAGYEIPGASQPETTAPAPDTGIINQQLTPQRDDRVIGLQETFTKDLSGDPRFNYLEPTAQANKYRFDRSVEPREGLLGFFDSAMNKMKESKFFQPKVRGTLGTRIANQPKIPLPGVMAAYTRSPFNPDSPTYNPLLEGQLNFLEGLEGMIGRDPNTGGLKYGSGSVLAGKNVISGFGSNNYEVALNKYLQRMNRYEKPTEFQKQKIAQAQAELAAEKERQIREAKTKAEALKAIKSQGKMDYNPNIHGPTNYGKDSQGNQSFDSGMGFGIGSDGGPVSNRTGRGRTGYSKGGLASMFVEKR